MVTLSSDEPLIEYGTEDFIKSNSLHNTHKLLKNNKVVREARDTGFKFEGKENRTQTEQYSKSTGKGNHATHPEYNKNVNEQLKNFAKENPNRIGDESLNFVRNLSKSLSDLIKNNPNTKVNDLFKSVMNAFTNLIQTNPPKKVALKNQ